MPTTAGPGRGLRHRAPGLVFLVQAGLFVVMTMGRTDLLAGHWSRNALAERGVLPGR
ncbi:hypothetical protein ACQPXM_12985 [Kribbella sp. CA-253562]|uniref:hypothetical protein n=1 Tax=Kribbella sp. CA-253562 TaxID=3239942 RepID=UPI003D8DADBA